MLYPTELRDHGLLLLQCVARLKISVIRPVVKTVKQSGRVQLN